MENQVLYIISATLLGIVIGILAMYLINGKSSGSKKSIAQVEEKLNDYQNNVVEHFEQTADLVDELTQSYKKVFDHLSKSAKQLMTEEQVKIQIEKRKDNKVTLGFLAEEDLVSNDEETINEVKVDAEIKIDIDEKSTEDTIPDNDAVTIEANETIEDLPESNVETQENKKV